MLTAEPTPPPSPRFGGMYIPARVLNAPDMNILDKILLTQIEALSRREQGCTATNAYLAETFGVNESTISRAVGRLETLALVAVSYAANNYRTIRLTRLACTFWMPDLEAGDEPETPSRRNADSSRRNAEQKLEEEVEEESYPTVSSTQAESLCPDSTAAAECLRSTSRACEAEAGPPPAAVADETQIRAELLALGNTPFQVNAILRLLRSNGRSHDWLRAWMEKAKRSADNPGAYLQRMVEANLEAAAATPQTTRRDDGQDPYSRDVPPERAAKIADRAEAEYQRTRRMCGELHDTRKATPEELELLHATMDQLKAKMTLDTPLAKARPKPISEEERETLAQVKAELQQRRAAS